MQLNTIRNLAKANPSYHYHFKPKDIDFGKDNLVIMTEKDAVKCQAFADERHWCLPIKAKVDENFVRELIIKLKMRKK